MKVLIINNFLYPKGGAEVVALETGKLLAKKGHQVYFWGMKHPNNDEYPYEQYFIENVDYFRNYSFVEKLNISLKILYSFEAKRKIEMFIREVVKPDIVHLHNFAHQISPSILDVFKKHNIPTVLTMHIYKLVCPCSVLYNGVPCERCKQGRYLWCFIKKCTKNSYSKSLLTTIEMYFHHKVLHIYDNIDIFISPSKFLAEKLIDMGFEKQIFVLPNFVSFDTIEPKYEHTENSICYFGRLCYEKGLCTLVKAMKGIPVTLKIIGENEGTTKEYLASLARDLSIENLEFLDHKTGEELHNEIKKSMFVVLPSEWYENNPRSIIESFALGKPVVGSRIGGIPELVIDNYTGLTFEAGNVEDLKEKILFLVKNPDKIVEFGNNARKFIKNNHGPEKHYKELIKFYQMAIEKH